MRVVKWAALREGSWELGLHAAYGRPAIFVISRYVDRLGFVWFIRVFVSSPVDGHNAHLLLNAVYALKSRRLPSPWQALEMFASTDTNAQRRVKTLEPRFLHDS